MVRQATKRNCGPRHFLLSRKACSKIIFVKRKQPGGTAREIMRGEASHVTINKIPYYGRGSARYVQDTNSTLTRTFRGS